MGEIPSQVDAVDVIRNLSKRLRNLEVRVADNNSRITAGSGAPSGTPRDGDEYIDVTAKRHYVGCDGTWRYAGLT